jgi:hypothetical protein
MIVYSAGIISNIFPQMKQPFKENSSFLRFRDMTIKAEKLYNEQTENAKNFLEGYEERKQ